MIIVTCKTTSNNKFDCVVSDRNSLVELLVTLEESKRIHQYKISLSEGILVKDVYVEFGLGHFSKFVTQFTWD